MSELAKKHHYLIAGTIVFSNVETGNIGSVPLNGVLVTDRQDLPLASLGKAQQVLQFNFHKTTGNSTEVKVENVVLQGFTYMGYFTEAEFKEPPKGMTLREASEAVVAAAESAVEGAVNASGQVDPAA